MSFFRFFRLSFLGGGGLVSCFLCVCSIVRIYIILGGSILVDMVQNDEIMMGFFLSDGW